MFLKHFAEKNAGAQRLIKCQTSARRTKAAYVYEQTRQHYGGGAPVGLDSVNSFGFIE
jgi:hypothetical protein